MGQSLRGGGCGLSLEGRGQTLQRDREVETYIRQRKRRASAWGGLGKARFRNRQNKVGDESGSIREQNGKLGCEWGPLEGEE